MTLPATRGLLAQDKNLLTLGLQISLGSEMRTIRGRRFVPRPIHKGS